MTRMALLTGVLSNSASRTDCCVAAAISISLFYENDAFAFSKALFSKSYGSGTAETLAEALFVGTSVDRSFVS